MSAEERAAAIYVCDLRQSIAQTALAAAGNDSGIAGAALLGALVDVARIGRTLTAQELRGLLRDVLDIELELDQEQQSTTSAAADHVLKYSAALEAVRAVAALESNASVRRHLLFTTGILQAGLNYHASNGVQS